MSALLFIGASTRAVDCIDCSNILRCVFDKLFTAPRHCNASLKILVISGALAGVNKLVELDYNNGDDTICRALHDSCILYIVYTVLSVI